MSNVLIFQSITSIAGIISCFGEVHPTKQGPITLMILSSNLKKNIHFIAIQFLFIILLQILHMSQQHTCAKISGDPLIKTWEKISINLNLCGKIRSKICPSKDACC